MSRWRSILACLPLPMLALAASYGVYSFSRLFVPPLVACIQAAAFEMTYIGLSVVIVKNDQRDRARMISIGAVLMSVIYNLLAGWLARVPDLVITASPISWLMLAALHGLSPWVAFLVSDLLLHRENTQDHAYYTQDDYCAPCEQPIITTNVINTILPVPDQTLAIESSNVIESEPIHDPYEYAMDLVLNGGKSIQESAKIAGVPYSTLWRRLQRYNKE